MRQQNQKPNKSGLGWQRFAPAAAGLKWRLPSSSRPLCQAALSFPCHGGEASGSMVADPSTLARLFPDEAKLSPLLCGSPCPCCPSMGTPAHPAAGKGPALPPVWLHQDPSWERGDPQATLLPLPHREERVGAVAQGCPESTQTGSAPSPRAVPLPTCHLSCPRRDPTLSPHTPGNPAMPLHGPCPHIPVPTGTPPYPHILPHPHRDPVMSLHGL